MSHADILDIDRGHVFRKHRHKNNKKSCCYLRENGKKPAVARVFARQLLWGACIKSAISHVRCAYAHIFDTESYNARDAEGFACKRSGGLPLGRWHCMIGLRGREIDEKQT